jgi:hypothetical protein
MGWVFNATTRPLYLLEIDLVPIVQEARWAPGPIWTVRKVADRIKLVEDSDHWWLLLNTAMNFCIS